MKMPLIKNGFFVTVLMSLDWRLFCAWSRKKKSHFRGKEVRWPDGCKVVKLNKRRLAEKEVPVDLKFSFSLFPAA